MPHTESTFRMLANGQPPEILALVLANLEASSHPVIILPGTDGESVSFSATPARVEHLRGLLSA